MRQGGVGRGLAALVGAQARGRPCGLARAEGGERGGPLVLARVREVARVVLEEVVLEPERGDAEELGDEVDEGEPRGVAACVAHPARVEERGAPEHRHARAREGHDGLAVLEELEQVVLDHAWAGA